MSSPGSDNGSTLDKFSWRILIEDELNCTIKFSGVSLDCMTTSTIIESNSAASDSSNSGNIMNRRGNISIGITIIAIIVRQSLVNSTTSFLAIDFTLLNDPLLT